MAGDDVDFSALFAAGEDDDDRMGFIDMQTKVLHEDNHPKDDDRMSFIDMQTSVLDEDSHPKDVEISAKDFSLINVSPGESGIPGTCHLQNDMSDSGTKDSVCLPANSARNCEHYPGSYMGSFSQGESNAICYTDRTGVSKREVAAYGVETSFSEAHSNNKSVYGDNMNLSVWKGVNESQFKHMGDDDESEHASHNSIIENDDVSFEDFFADIVGGVSGQQGSDSCTSFQLPDIGFIENYLSSSVADPSTGLFPDDISSQLWTNEEMTSNLKAENVEFYNDMAHVSSGMLSASTRGLPIQDSQFTLADSGHPSIFSGNVTFEDKESLPLPTRASYLSRGNQPLCGKAERDELITPYQNNFHNNDAKLNVGQEAKQLPGVFPSTGYRCNGCFPFENNYAVTTSGLTNHYQDIIEGTASKLQGNMGSLNLKARVKSLPHAQASIAGKKHFRCAKREGGGQMVQHKDSHHSIRRAENFQVEDDSDVCVIEDISHAAPTSKSAHISKSLSISQSSSRHVDPQPCMVRSTRPKACDERNILRVALQDLSQPKSEASPPDGWLAVPLLRHQRIALSWMVQKETSSLYCSGGILADDQGLGKTVSTIALILKERAPIFTACPNTQDVELETFNLDAEDDVLPQNGLVKKESETCGGDMSVSISNPIKSKISLMQAKGRPSAGTLIVCPTCVLRQWAEELHNKVTSQANLSVLVYHGSNRTKDPHEVAKHDVVLTTFSIVSMEVPKQPLVDKDDEKGDFEDPDVPSRKRKSPSNSSKSSKKKLDGKMVEAVAGPLAKVSWFRVVLDEAQSIKNHRTQVARACWGLRAKRRWCLSGTPIQNAIDDVFSYFRFLKYAPYDIYKSFCSMIKDPISRSPTKGYRKLQAVLKTIMLRRTKGTLLDGEPIISLPPKSVELKAVDFSREERDFYSRLEADSRAQFQEYADAGTVKQNYVNILLMLLRLRQACDHPLLVKSSNSNSLWRSSVEAAKKLPQEKQISLLKCLEASLALCGICKDPPEDAVVSVCGHVFCSQCISEHLIGDDNQCPATNCKTRLSTSSIFSKAMLNGCLSNQACDNSPGCSGSEVDESESWSQGQSYISSKIKAVLEVLKSLRKVQSFTSKNISAHRTLAEGSDCPGISSGVNNRRSVKDFPEGQNLSGNRSSSGVGEKAIVFSQWTRMLDLLEVCLKNSSIQYRRLDGTMSVNARDKAVKDFNTLPEVTVMIMSLKAASLGLNMVAACHVLMLDLWWNPTTEDQAIDRAHRIGQTRPVSVLRLTVRDTVEDRILALQEKKRKMVASAFGEDGTGGRRSRLTVDDLKYLFMM